MAESVDDNQERIIEDAVQQFVDAQLRGEEPDIDEFVKKYPALDHQIRENIQDLLKINGLFTSIVQTDESDFDSAVTGDDLVGRKVESFEIVEMIGRGGMGVVYLARDTKLDRSVALKSMPADLQANSTAQTRFRREAKLLASLNHPNIAVIHDIIEQDKGAAYLILEYVPGETLAERIARNPLQLEQALSIGRQVADALSAAHEKGVTHRDLKPGNIKITPEGKVKVLDFGLAKAVGGEALDRKSTITQPGRIIGTPAYMSPEQARGQPTDTRSDIWSFGCVMYEMLTGKVPFEGETVSDTLVSLLEREPDWDLLPQTTPANIQVLLRRCLEKEPHRRLRDMGDIAITLEDTVSELQHPTLRTETAEANRTKATVGSRRASPWFTIGPAAAIVLFLALIIVFKLGGPSERQQGKAVAEFAAGPIKAIVVLPFKNLSGDMEQEYFVDGMTDALSAELGKIKALSVISRTSAMRYKNTDKKVPEIAEELSVDAVIEGSVLKVGNDVRITAQLVDGRIDAHLWSDNYTGTLTNILALQSEVTLAIAREIEVALTREEERRITRREPIKPEAYEAYLKGILFMEKHTEEAFKIAAEYFNRAIAIEPNFAAAHAWLGGAYWVPSLWGHAPPHESFAKGKTAMYRAVELDQINAEARGGVGWIALHYDWDWQNAKVNLERSIELNPNYIYGYHGLAWYLVVAGRYEAAIDMMHTAIRLDPFSHVLNNGLASMYSFSGQLERAIEQRERILQWAPGYVETLSGLAEDYLSMSQYAEAVITLKKAMDLAGRRPGLVAGLGRAYALSGRKDEAEILLQELRDKGKSEYVLPMYLAAFYGDLGNIDEAFRWLEKVYQERHYGMFLLRVPSSWEPLRTDPRFDNLLERMNFPK